MEAISTGLLKCSIHNVKLCIRGTLLGAYIRYKSRLVAKHRGAYFRRRDEGRGVGGWGGLGKSYYLHFTVRI